MGHHRGVRSAAMSAAAHRNSHTSSSTTTTMRPKIKIIHIIAPEIIKTDTANFREIVQKLTGKPAGRATSTADDMVAAATPAPPLAEEKEMAKKSPAPATAAQPEPPNKKRKIKCEVKVEEAGFGDYDLDRNELWMDMNPGGFLSFLEEEVDVFQGLAAADDFLQLPLGSSNFLGEMYAS